MKSLRYSIIAHFIFQKHKRDVEIIFSVIKNIKKNNKTKNFKDTSRAMKISQKVNKKHCKILIFDYPNTSHCNYPKISKIKPQKDYVLFHNAVRNRIIDYRILHTLSLV